jgi:hypothetical protein
MKKIKNDKIKNNFRFEIIFSNKKTVIKQARNEFKGKRN